MIYYAVFGILATLSLLGIAIRGHQLATVGMVAAVIVLFVFGGLRFEVGADWEPYREMFLQSAYRFDFRTFQSEYLYQAANYVLSSNGIDYVTYIGIAFAVALGLKLFGVYRLTPYLGVSLLVYYTTLFTYFDINGIRQGLALGMSILALKFVTRGQLAWYVVAAGAAVAIHVSAIIFVPCYWLARAKLSPRTCGLLVIAAICARPVLGMIVTNQTLLSVMLSHAELLRFENYMQDEHYGSGVGLFDLATLQRLVVLGAFIVAWKRVQMEASVKNILLNVYAISVIVFIMFSAHQEMAARLSVYYKAADLIILPALITAGRGMGQRLAIFLTILAYCAALLFRTMSIPDNYLTPYNNALTLNWHRGL